MRHRYLELLSTPSVVRMREALDGEDRYAMDGSGPLYHAELGAAESVFIAARDSFYVASVSETGWPYIQHRGGPRGFLRTLDAHTLGFADFRGNRQYLTLGNTAVDPRVALFLMDYPRQRRLKLLGTLEVTTDPAVLARLALPGYKAVVERGLLIRVAAVDWNCPQHITPRFTAEEVEAMQEPLRRRIAELEARPIQGGGASSASH